MSIVTSAASAKPGHYQINGDNLSTAFSNSGSDNDVPAMMNVDAETGLPRDIQQHNGKINNDTITIDIITKKDLSAADFLPTAETSSETDSTPDDKPSQMMQACFAAGCFWGTQAFFKREFGKRGLIHNLRVGYTGGATDSPVYTEVKKGNTGHVEVLVFDYDPSAVTYAQLCDYFFRFHNPCSTDAQVDDVGTQYRSAIFVYDGDQRAVAEATINQWNGADEVRHTLLQKTHGAGSRVVTAVCDGAGMPFWDAEEYHQAYLDKNPAAECNHRMYIKAHDLAIM